MDAVIVIVLSVIAAAPWLGDTITVPETVCDKRVPDSPS
jgi:hypothetical protein